MSADSARPKDYSGPIALIAGSLFLLLLTIFALMKFIQGDSAQNSAPASYSNAFVMDLDLPLEDSGPIANAASAMYLQPDQYTEKVSLAPSNCHTGVHGVSAQLHGKICKVEINRRTWTAMQTMGNPRDFAESLPVSDDSTIRFDLRGEAQLYLFSPRLWPHYIMPDGVGQGVSVYYTPQGIEWVTTDIDFE